MKEITCLLVRHGKTAGNTEGRYIGCRTDEDLCTEGIEELKTCAVRDMSLHLSRTVYVSPLKRCRQTANHLFPACEEAIEEDFREIDFGRFENKNHGELSGDDEYEKWLASGGTRPFPEGESRDAFIDRNVKAFVRILLQKAEEDDKETIPFVIHGGSIMAIMSALTGKDYFDFQIPCADGYLVKCLTGEKTVDVISYDRICGGGAS